MEPTRARRRWWGWSYCFRRCADGELITLEHIYRRWEVGAVLPLVGAGGKLLARWVVLERRPSAEG